MDLHGKTALITGAASGIGAATARLLSERGAALMLTDVDADAGQALAGALREAGGDVTFTALDVSAEQGWPIAFAALERWRGEAGRIRAPLSVLVNSAGIARRATIEDCTFEDWQKTLAINLTGTFLGCQWAVRTMKGHGGSIINISSIFGLVGDARVPAYNASKGGVALLTKSVALHGASLTPKIRANSIHPGFVETPMVLDAPGRAPAERDQMLGLLRETTPLGRLARPVEIARAIAFLASDESSYMTGSELVVDGGWTAR